VPERQDTALGRGVTFRPCKPFEPTAADDVSASATIVDSYFDQEMR